MDNQNYDLHEMVEVPILIDFDYKKPIGTLKIRKDALPPTPNFVFSLGYTALEGAKYELMSVSVVNDRVYAEHLKD